MTKYILKVFKKIEERKNEIGQITASTMMMPEDREIELFSGEMDADQTVEILDHAYTTKLRNNR